MGSCISGGKVSENAKKYAQNKNNTQLHPKEIAILKLIYEDLSTRIQQHKINLQNFLLFFHKNGYWGSRLFREFDCDQTKLISKQEFIVGIANIFKSSETQKISLLFKFFSKNGDINDGVYFDQFLIMLYNYPKEDLKWILNDRYFFETSIKNITASADGKKKSQQHHIYQIDASRQREHRSQESERSYGTPYPSMICKEIKKNIEEKFNIAHPTTIKIDDGDDAIEVKATNIQSLVKLFAKRIFKEEKIDIKNGKLNFEQFHHWISIHRRLFQNYYDGFHNFIWEIDENSQRPKFLSYKCDHTSFAKILKNNEFINCSLYLHHSILVVCESTNLQHPLQVICLEGLIVQRIYQTVYGFGFSITHRDGVYKEKRIFVKNEAILCEWMDHLRYYNGQPIQQRYQIGQKIGAGRFSVVYHCKSLVDHKQYALKEIPSYKLDQQSKNLIAHESSIMKVISHPLFLEYKECVQTRTHMYIVTEYVKGRDLFDYVKQKNRLCEYDAAKILLQLIVGIRYLHSFDIVHRDLKPENIMIVCDQDTEEISYIKIIDFGFSNYLSALAQKHAQQLLTGTPNYIAPEILKQEGISYKIDNFAIGSILYFMLTGNLAFNDTSITGILLKTIKGQYKVSQKYGLSKQCVHLLDQLLKNNPNQRISLSDAISHPWFEILKTPRKVKRAPFASSGKPSQK